MTLYAGIVDWNPCGGSRTSSGRSSYIVSVGTYLYVHCTSPGSGSFLMQCPGVSVWNPQTNGCTDFGSGLNQSPPRLVGPLNQVGDRTTSTSTAGPPQEVGSYQKPFFAGLPYALLASVTGTPSTLLRPPQSAGDLAVQLTINPCVVDSRGTLSTVRLHAHPDDPAKYLECVPEQRFVTAVLCFRK